MATKTMMMEKPPMADHDSGYAPPPYEQYSSQAPSVSSSSRSPGTTLKFPPKFIYHYKWFSSTSYLGLSKDEPLFAVKTSNAMTCWKRKQIVLHDGTDKLCAPLASTGAKRGTKCRRSQIRVAPKPGSGLSADDSMEVVMDGDYCMVHGFTLQLDDGRTERFEWRNTKGEEVKALSGGFTTGWKLVRLDGPVVAPGQTDGGHGYTSDGKEVVALAAHPRWFKNNPTFGFMGAGARGELGETFELVAVMGFLRLYDLYIEQQSANGAAASSSSGAAAAVAAA